LACAAGGPLAASASAAGAVLVLLFMGADGLPPAAKASIKPGEAQVEVGDTAG
jgi:hypothetical protein